MPTIVGSTASRHDRLSRRRKLNAIVQTARSAGRPVVAHATTPEGIRRAVNAGVETIEHGDEGTLEIFRLMKQKGVALCPTVAAGDAVSRYPVGRRALIPSRHGL